uniref:Transcription factor GRAS n=1 Tax=Saccharum hybrid cultivar R570 TaxID=131158 RepID=A0A059Q0Z6_9POAL|nr:Transcription factor GRAS [Saccharum hybrid cultivar R570]AGT16948.1 hypothetical protein SHCRBa_028_D11_R_90 [Saccharum hybrid cultivar R570]AGT17092.1 hypothetical protein SHCRBa_084_G07_R_200 [Saccharum hybrid cultivar R570]
MVTTPGSGLPDSGYPRRMRTATLCSRWTLRIDFQYQGLVSSSLADLKPFILRPDSEETDDEPEVIAVNSMFELHRLLAVPGALEKVLGTGVAGLLQALEGAGSFQSANDKAMAEVYLNQQICNVVACEGTERHETLGQWRDRLLRAGFKPHRLGSDVREHASTLLALFSGGDGYRVEVNAGCITLGWHTRPLIATSHGASPTPIIMRILTLSQFANKA